MGGDVKPVSEMTRDELLSLIEDLKEALRDANELKDLTVEALRFEARDNEREACMAIARKYGAVKTESALRAQWLRD